MGDRRPVVAYLSVYPPSQAGPRLRGRQYGPFLEEAGLEPAWWSFFREEDLGWWFGPSHVRRALVLARALVRLVRLPAVVRRASLVVVLREAVPLGPPVVEWLAARRRPLVWDVDDAVWEPHPGRTISWVPGWLRRTASKYERLCRMATEVWAGSEVLATWCRRHNDEVVVVPTVVDVPADLPSRPPGRIVTWIGSPATAAFLEAILPALAAVTPPVKVVVVGAEVAVPDRLDVEVRSWSSEAEAEALASAAVGLYPIDPAHPLAEGKCGLKAILYMAHGVVPVMTPTTTNAAVVRDGVDGFHARTAAEWATAVTGLLDDPERWEDMRRAGHDRARSRYSLAVWGPKMAARAATLAAGRELGAHPTTNPANWRRR
jgi:glycosyltransferase involved in cell wall biosynthesis